MKWLKTSDNESFSMIAKTMSGLEEVLGEELRELGAAEIEIIKRAVAFQGDKALLYKANYLLRTALRILVPAWHFEAGSEKALYKHVRDIDWTEIFDHRQSFAIDAVAVDSYFTHTQYVSQLVKDAVVDCFRDKKGRRPSVNLDQPDIRLNVHINRQQVDLSLDSSGTSLHKRGYRVQTHDAPLSEVLAAGLVRLSGWDMQSAFVDPMCGSGTLLTEAAMAAMRIPAGRYIRRFAFQNWQDYDESLWKRVQQEAGTQILSSLPFMISGCDISRKSIYQARENIAAAGLEKMISLQHTDFRRFDPPPAPACVITNPPYGERISVEDITRLYQELGNALKNKYSGYKAWVISADEFALKMIGLRPFRRLRVFNGPIECRVFGFDLYQGKKHASG
ncbi:MAG TPA: THUMP domain-containing protein [Bacteroidales bacterium]|nr:THUMP domain-containing protein [Bacteroidales bacterium]HSA42898.1 THUMP domain-containing protein [Bacteroidales bacterium]